MLMVNVLAGFGSAAIVSGGGGAVSSLAFNSSAVASAANLTAPAGIIAGDLLVFLDYAAGPTIPTSAVPSGFTSDVDIAQSASGRVILSHKIAVGTEGGTSIHGMTSSSYRKIMGVFRPNATITTATAGSPVSQTTDADPSSQNIAASGGVAPLVALCGYVSTGTIATRTMSPAKDGEIDVGDQITYLAYKIYNSSPADVSVDMPDAGSRNTLVSCYVACS